MTQPNHKLFKYLRTTKLDHFLVLVANALRGMFERNEPVMKVPAIQYGGLIPVKGNIDVAAWSLSDVAYFAIRETNDFGTRIISVHDLVALCNEFIHWDESVSLKELKDLSDPKTILKFAIGFSQKQFWYQERFRITREFNRQVELLEKIPQQIQSNLDLDKACESETGFGLRSFRTLLFALLLYGVHNSDLTYPSTSGWGARYRPEITPSNLKRIIEYYAADYEEYRFSPLAENHFYVKPIVRTTQQRLINVNQFLLARKVADGPFWALRDHFHKNDSLAFVNEYGRYFERYVSNLLSLYLSSSQYERIPEINGVKTADWFVFTNGYRLIIEQKTALAPLFLKRLYPDIEDISVYLSRLEEAVFQLDSTEHRYADSRITIKLLLHYETLYFSDGVLRRSVVSKVSSSLHSSERLFFLDIDEFEWLIAIIGLDKEIGDRILDEKLRRESGQPGISHEFSGIIPSITGIENVYMLHAIDHWTDYIKNSE